MSTTLADALMNDLADALMNEIRRVRDGIMPQYLAIGRSGVPALTLMRRDLDAAVRALAEQDATACLRCLEELKGYTA
jgi:hypothetical protein